MGSTAKRTDPGLWERVKQAVTDGDKGGASGTWSARKAQMAVQAYQQQGGGYEGGRRADNSLHQWTEQDRTRRESDARRPPTLAALRAEARKRGIPGRSKMSHEALRRAISQ